MALSFIRTLKTDVDTHEEQEQALDLAIESFFQDETVRTATAIWKNRDALPQALRDDLEIAAQGLDPNQSHIVDAHGQTVQQQEAQLEDELRQHKADMAQRESELADRKQMLELGLHPHQDEDTHTHERD